jgi:hypothetical protein
VTSSNGDPLVPRTIERQVTHAGGALQVLPGIYLAMAVIVDLRYLHPKYAHFRSCILLVDLHALYDPTREFERWLMSLPVFLMVGKVLFAHRWHSSSLARGQPYLPVTWASSLEPGRARALLMIKRPREEGEGYASTEAMNRAGKSRSREGTEDHSGGVRLWRGVRPSRINQQTIFSSGQMASG